MQSLRREARARRAPRAHTRDVCARARAAERGPMAPARNQPTRTGVLTTLVLATILLVLRATKAAPVPSATDVLVVLAGGVDDNGVPHETVMRRLRRAEKIYSLQRASTRAPSIVCNGGGTTHKPKWVDPAGYAVPEAALMGRQLMALGVSASDVFVEGCAWPNRDRTGPSPDRQLVCDARTLIRLSRADSDDTIGNAFFLRVMHADTRPDWTRLRVITSEFQMARTKAIYDWMFSLQPLPPQKQRYELTYEAVDDAGALSERVLRVRQRKENLSLHSFLDGDVIRFTKLAQVHEWLYLKHDGYTASGLTSKKPLDRSSNLAQTY